MICGKEPMAGNLELDQRTRLIRERLLDQRSEMLGHMLRRGTPEPAHLPLLAGINAALDTIDGMPVEAEAAARAVVVDDGRQIRLTLYSETGAVADVALDPCRAITIAGKLIEAALPRLKGRMTR
jgi:hypothetical protein